MKWMYFKIHMNKHQMHFLVPKMFYFAFTSSLSWELRILGWRKWDEEEKKKRWSPIQKTIWEVSE